MSGSAQTVTEGKGKGKAVDTPHDVSMGEDDSSSDEETGAEDEVLLWSRQCIVRSGTSLTQCTYSQRKSVSLITPILAHTERSANTDAIAAEEEDDDNMEEIDTDNIISDGRRTRGKSIDFAKAAENAGEALDDDDDDEEDDDFEEKEDDNEMKN